MPTADSYNYFCSLNTTTGLGAGGNGLPLFSDAIALRKVDISTYDRSNVLTIQQLAPIYWNCYKVLCECEIETAGGNPAASIDEAEFDSSDAGYQPKNRRANATPPSITASNGSNPSAELGLSSLTTAVRLLYNGSTSDSSNFVGYGFENLIIAKVRYFVSLSGDRETTKTISSFINEQSDSTGTTYTYSTVSIGGANFVQELKEVDSDLTGSFPNPTRSVGNITLDFFTY